MDISKVYVVVPCYNEGSVLPATLAKLFPLQLGGIIVVDDGSTEDVYSSVKELPVHFLRHGVNLGQGAALQTGMDYARKLGAEAVIHFDADGQHRAEDIPRFIAVLDSCDAVLGSRFLTQEDIAAIPRGKRFLLRVARIVNWLFTGMLLTDAHNGFRALGPAALQKIDLQENRMAHATEILSQLKRHGLKVKEIAVRIDYTDYSRAKGQRWYNSINILFDLLISKIF